MADEVTLDRIARELKDIRALLTKVINAHHAGEEEIPEHIQRFCMYMHNLHSISWMYHENGQIVPPHINAEMERCDDRFRQLLAAVNTDGGAFERVRREMAADPNNRWDHTKQLEKPK